jgi:hypothetical protein
MHVLSIFVKIPVMPYFQKKNSATYVYKNLRKFGGRNPNQNWAQAQNTKH